MNVLYVKFNDNSAELVARQLDVTARQHHWAPVKKRKVMFGRQKNRQHPSVKRSQLSLTLSLACTVCKVQDLSLAEGAAAFELESQ